MEEKVYFQNGSVTVTSTRLVSGDNVYAIHGIVSFTVQRASGWLNKIAKVLGTLFLLSCLFHYEFFNLALALALLVYGIYFGTTAKLVIRDAAGDRTAYVGKSAQEIANALSQAIAARR